MFIREDEKIDEIGFGGLKLIQSSEGFRYGVDAVVLADFAATLSSGGRRVFDLGTGSGVIPLILSHKMPKSVLTGVEDAMEKIGEVTGSTLREDITSRIFERFCVGK